VVKIVIVSKNSLAEASAIASTFHLQRYEISSEPPNIFCNNFQQNPLFFYPCESTAITPRNLCFRGAKEPVLRGETIGFAGVL